MRKGLSLILFIFLLNWSDSIAQNRDSLYHTWKNVELSDSTRLKALLELVGEYYLHLNADSTFMYADTLIKEAREQKNYRYVGKALRAKGISTYFKGDYSNSINYLNESLRIFQEIDYLDGIGNVKNNIALSYKYLGEIDSSEKYLFGSLEAFEKSKNQQGMANVYGNLGSSFSNKGEYLKSLEYFRRSIHISDSLENYRFLAASYNNIAQVYELLRETDLPLEYYQKAMVLNDSFNNTYGLIANYINIANIHIKKGAPKTAIQWLKKSLTLSESSGHDKGISYTYISLGMAYDTMGLEDSAYYYYEQCLRYSEEINFKSQILNSKAILAQSNYNKGNYSTSIKLGKEAWPLSLALKDVERQIDLSGILSKAYSSQNQLEEAFRFLQIHSQLKDSFNIIELGRQVAIDKFNSKMVSDSIETAATLKMIDSQLRYEQSEKEKEKQRTIFLSFFLVLTLLIAFVIYNRFRKVRQQNKLIDEAHNEIKNLYGSLELRVEEKTKELQSQNERLKNYAFYNAHKLRGPYCRVEGIINLMDQENKIDISYSSMLKESLKELNDSIGHIQKIVAEEPDILELDPENPNKKPYPSSE